MGEFPLALTDISTVACVHRTDKLEVTVGDKALQFQLPFAMQVPFDAPLPEFDYQLVPCTRETGRDVMQADLGVHASTATARVASASATGRPLLDHEQPAGRVPATLGVIAPARALATSRAPLRRNPIRGGPSQLGRCGPQLHERALADHALASGCAHRDFPLGAHAPITASR